MTVRKSKKANLENKRTIFLEVGIIVTLSFVLLAFEWTTVRSHNDFTTTLDGEAIDEDMVDVTIHKVDKLVVPVPKVTPIIIPSDNDDIEVDDFIVDAEVTEDDFNNLNQYIPEINEIEDEDDVILVFVQNYPEFPGGQSAMFQYLAKNLKYTKAAKEIGIQGKMLVSFVVWRDGTIRNIKIRRSLGAGLDEEAIRVIKSMPLWKPGNQNGKNVNVEFNIPVQFTLN